MYKNFKIRIRGVSNSLWRGEHHPRPGRLQKLIIHSVYSSNTTYVVTLLLSVLYFLAVLTPRTSVSQSTTKVETIIDSHTRLHSVRRETRCPTESRSVLRNSVSKDRIYIIVWPHGVCLISTRYLMTQGVESLTRRSVLFGVVSEEPLTRLVTSSGSWWEYQGSPPSPVVLSVNGT